MTWSLWVNSQVPECCLFLLRGLWCILLGSYGRYPPGLAGLYNSMAYLICIFNWWSLQGGWSQTDLLDHVMVPILEIFNPSHLLLHEDPPHINLFILLLPWLPQHFPSFLQDTWAYSQARWGQQGARNRAEGLPAQSSHSFPSLYHHLGCEAFWSLMNTFWMIW